MTFLLISILVSLVSIEITLIFGILKIRKEFYRENDMLDDFIHKEPEDSISSAAIISIGETSKKRISNDEFGLIDEDLDDVDRELIQRQ